jgi:hypothetical protein
MQKITFIDLIKLVHPDHTPGNKHASHERAVLVIKYRDNPKKLLSLAKSWGILGTKKLWEVKRRGLKTGDIITFLIHQEHGIRRIEGLITNVMKTNDEYVGVVLDEFGNHRTFTDRLLKVFKVKFKSTCKDMKRYIFNVKVNNKSKYNR